MWKYAIIHLINEIKAPTVRGLSVLENLVLT